MCPLNSARHFRFSKRKTSSGFIRSRCVLLRVCEYGRVDEYTGENSGIIGIWLEAHLILGKSYRQIAREQGVDKSVVRRSVKRGMAAMKKYLKKVL